MTHLQFKQHYFQNMYEEIAFIHGRLPVKSWWTKPEAIEHGKMYKKQWHDHMYKMRCIDYGTLQYT